MSDVRDNTFSCDAYETSTTILYGDVVTLIVHTVKEHA